MSKELDRLIKWSGTKTKQKNTRPQFRGMSSFSLLNLILIYQISDLITPEKTSGKKCYRRKP